MVRHEAMLQCNLVSESGSRPPLSDPLVCPLGHRRRCASADDLDSTKYFRASALDLGNFVECKINVLTSTDKIRHS